MYDFAISAGLSLLDGALIFGVSLLIILAASLAAMALTNFDG